MNPATMAFQRQNTILTPARVGIHPSPIQRNRPSICSVKGPAFSGGRWIGGRRFCSRSLLSALADFWEARFGVQPKAPNAECAGSRWARLPARSGRSARLTAKFECEVQESFNGSCMANDLPGNTLLQTEVWRNSSSWALDRRVVTRSGKSLFILEVYGLDRWRSEFRIFSTSPSSE
jgi:hypothetical protein